jgi:hypothetical protein
MYVYDALILNMEIYPEMQMASTSVNTCKVTQSFELIYTLTNKRSIILFQVQ